MHQLLSSINVIVSFSWLHAVVGLVQQTQPIASPCPLLISRRNWIVSAAAPPVFIAVGVLAVRPQAAMAVKERNEALCGTGFFTNIWEYRCTELGDIADEGVGKSFSASELGTADSLMSKLKLESSSSSSTTSTKEKQESTSSINGVGKPPQTPSLGSVKENLL